MLNLHYYLGNVEKTDKQIAVVDILNEDFFMSTKKMSVLSGVSKRYIQKIRKHLKDKLIVRYEELKKYGMNNFEFSKISGLLYPEKNKNDNNTNKERNEKMENEDTFDTNLNAMSDLQIEIVNTMNEGGWSTKELSDRFSVSEECIKEILDEYSSLVVTDVLDENDGNVFFDNYNKTEEEEEKEEEKDDDKVVDYMDYNNRWRKNTRFNQNIEPPEDNFWEVEIEHVTACSKVNDKVKVFMNKKSRDKATLFMKWAGSREWLAYLVGNVLEDGNYNITDLYLPDQRTSATLVDDVNAEEYNEHSVVGVIHSHHDMGAGQEDKPSFSGHDDNFINGNHNLSLLAGKSGDGFKINGTARVKTPCGGLMKIKAKVLKMNEMEEDVQDELKKEFMSKTQTRRNGYFGHGHVNQNYSCGNGCSGVVDKRNINGITTYHYGNGGWPGNQFNKNGQNINKK